MMCKNRKKIGRFETRIGRSGEMLKRNENSGGRLGTSEKDSVNPVYGEVVHHKKKVS